MKPEFIPRYTYDDYVNWKEDWELIGGLPFSLLPSPVIRHGKVQAKANFQAQLSLQNNKGCNCLVLSEIDWKINQETVVRPDMMIVCGEPKTDFLEFPPALNKEVFSPASRQKDRNIKIDLNQEQGVRYYLMADYERHTLEAYELTDNKYREVTKTSFLLEPGCEVSFDVAGLWE
jgi:Uma2 family endonuclease